MMIMIVIMMVGIVMIVMMIITNVAITTTKPASPQRGERRQNHQGHQNRPHPCCASHMLSPLGLRVIVRKGHPLPICLGEQKTEAIGRPEASSTAAYLLAAFQKNPGSP
jgi:hypothetical protein